MGKVDRHRAGLPATGANDNESNKKQLCDYSENAAGGQLRADKAALLTRMLVPLRQCAGSAR